MWWVGIWKKSRAEVTKNELVGNSQGANYKTGAVNSMVGVAELEKKVGQI